MDNAQIPLICDTLKSSLDAVVVALGGKKSAGHLLWPALDPDDAGRKLSHCLNPDKREKLSPEELIQLLREGRRIGCHTAMAFLTQSLGYADPQPIEPEDERAALQRQFIEQSKALQRLVGQMERVGLRLAS